MVTVVKLPGHQHCPRLRVVKLGSWPERWMLRLTINGSCRTACPRKMVSRVRNDVKLRRVGGDSCKTAWPPTLPTIESRKAGCLARKMDVEIDTMCWSH